MKLCCWNIRHFLWDLFDRRKWKWIKTAHKIRTRINKKKLIKNNVCIKVTTANDWLKLKWVCCVIDPFSISTSLGPYEVSGGCHWFGTMERMELDGSLVNLFDYLIICVGNQKIFNQKYLSIKYAFKTSGLTHKLEFSE